MSGRGPRWITKPTFTVQITGNPMRNYGYVTIDGTDYTAEAILKVYRHQAVNVTISSHDVTQDKNCKITMDGAIVQNGAGTYTFNLESDVIIDLEKHGTSYPYYTCSITTK